MRLTLALTLVAAALWAAPAQAQNAWTVGWMQGNCAAAAKQDAKPEDAMAAQICLSYVVGWRDTLGLHRATKGPTADYCLPESGDVMELAGAFVDWAKANPARAGDYVALGLRDAWLESFGCGREAKPKPRRKGGTAPRLVK